MPDIKTRNPFKFLNAFNRDEGKSFEGRDEEINLLYDMVRRRNIVLVYGESGVGKTSLIQCGLANKFQSADWYDVLVLRKDNINNSLRVALINHIENSEIDKANSGIVALVDALYVENFKPVYLIFDQIEELYVSNDEDERDIFYDTIAKILKASNSYCKIIFVIREDFLAKLNDFESRVAPLFSTGLRVTRMKPANALKVIKKALEENVSVVEADPGIDEISESIVNACVNNGVVHLLKLQICLHILYEEAPAIEGTQKRLFTDSLIQTVTKVKDDDLLKVYLEKTVKSINKENDKSVWVLLNKFISTQNTRKTCNVPDLYDTYTSVSDMDHYLARLKEKQILRQIDEKHIELMHDSLIPVIQKFQPKSKRPRREKPILQENPYKGLISYDESDFKIFYGRQEVIYELYEKVKKSSIVPVVGASGAGKSSLIKAGLFPKLRGNGFSILPVIKPGKFPDQHIEFILNAINCDSTHCKYILYIDQYEEVFSQCEDQKKRQDFILFLRALVEQPYSHFQKAIELRIILSVRADFEPQVQNLFLEGYWNSGRYTVPPFSKDQLREIIEEPAYLAGLEFTPVSLVDTIVSEVDQRSNLLPLLSYTLSELYERRTNGFLTQEDYESLGGVVGSLSKSADAIYDSLDKDKQRSMQNVFIRMLSLSSGELAGRRAAESEFVYTDDNETRIVASILNSLIESRLIYCTRDSEGNILYEPAHDSLVRSWGKLWSWINEENGKEILSLQSQLRGALLSYKEGVLWDTNTRLYLLEDRLKSKDNWLNRKETEFVQASIRKRNEQADIIRKHEQERAIINQKLLEEGQKANILLQEKLAEEQKSALLLSQKIEEEKKATKLSKEKLLEEKKSRRNLKIGIAFLMLLLIISSLLLYEINSLNNNYERALGRVDVQKEPFATSTLGSLSIERYTDTLLKIKFDEKNISKYNKLIAALNKVSGSLKEAVKNPNKALVITKQAYDIYPLKFIDSIGLSIANTSLFYENKIDITYKLGSRIYLTALSKDKSHFAFSTLNGVRAGIIKKDSIVLEKQPLSEILNTKNKSALQNNYVQPARLLSLGYTDNNDLIAVTTNNKIYQWNSTGKNLVVHTIPQADNNSSFNYVSVSPDGKKLVRDHNNVQLKIFDLKSLKDKFWTNNFNPEGSKIAGIIYSPDGKKVIVTTENYKCWILDVVNQTSKRLSISLVYIANFTPDGKHIIYEGKDSISICDLEGNKVGSNVFKDSENSERYTSQKLSLSNDWKNVIMLHPLYGNRLFESWNDEKQKDSIFYLTAKKRIIKTTRISADGAFDFLHDNSILSYTRPAFTDSVYVFSLLLLKRYEYFNNFQQAYSSIHPY